MDQKPLIEYVYFDLGNVLVSFDPQTACQNVSDLLGVSQLAADQAIYQSGLQDRFERGEVSSAEYTHQVALSLGVPRHEVPEPELMRAISDMFAPIESMGTTLSELRRRGTRFGLLSNTCSAHWDWVVGQEWSSVNHPFEHTILSYEIGAMKPSPQIYHAAREAADVPAEGILFLDDREENVTAASEQGWNAVQCVGGREAESALRRFGVIG